MSGINITSGNTQNIYNNTISNLTGNTLTTGSVRGILISGGTLINVYQNTISGLTANANTSGTVSGLWVSGGASINVSRNKIYDISSTSTIMSGSVQGIQVSGSTAYLNTTISNNIIGSISAPYANTDNSVRGINLNASGLNSNMNVYYNTIYINASSTGTDFGSSGIYHAASNVATTGSLDLRNNIISNNSGANGTGLTVAFRRSAIDPDNYASTSNNNLFFAGIPGANKLIYYDGTNGDQTLINFKTRISPRDAASATEDMIANMTFLSVSGANANYLHIDTAITTFAESGAAPISGIDVDYDGNPRNATTPDIGADEFGGSIAIIWKGAISDDWGEPGNWVGNNVPGVNEDIFFDDFPLNHCRLDQLRSVNNITNGQSTYRLVLNGEKLIVKGSLFFTGGAQIDASANNSVIEFAGILEQSIPDGVFYNNNVYNITINNTGGVALGSNTTVTGTLALSSGTLAIGPNTLEINGDITQNSGNLTGGNSSNMSFGGSGSAIILPAGVNALNNLTINRVNGISLSGSVTVSGSLTLANGVLSLGANSLNLNGTISQTSGSFLGGNSSNISIGGSGAAITLPAVSGGLNNLSLNRANGLLMGTSCTIYGTLSLTNGTLDVGANTLNLAGSSPIVTSGAVIASALGATIEYSGVNQTIVLPTSGYYNLILSGSGIKTMPVSALDILGDFTMNGTATATITAPFNISGTTRLNNSSILSLGGTDLFPDDRPIDMNGGTFNTGITAYSETLGTLNLSNNSTIALGAGGHILTCANSIGQSWATGKILTISGWTGAFNGTSGTAGKIFFGDSNAGLTAGQLATIRFFKEDALVYYSALLLPTGELVPDAEVSSWTWKGITSTEWNEESNWFSLIGEVPPVTANVIISPGTFQPIIHESNTCFTLKIETGSVLTISGTGALTVTSLIINNAGTSGLVIRSTSDAAYSTGSLFNNTSSVNATVERWMKGDIWHLISPAATGGQTVADFVGVITNANLISRNTINYGLAPYNVSNDSWDYYKVGDPNTDPFGVPGKGYQILRASGAGTGKGNTNFDGIVSFKGTLAAGNQSIAIAQTGNGWNLIGNPYPCGLNIENFMTTNSSSIDPGGSFQAIYVANVEDTNTYGYSVLNNSTDPGFNLSSGEGFFVKSKTGGGIINFTTSMKRVTSNAFKSAKMLYPEIKLYAETKTDKMSTSVKYISGMSTGLDPGWDAGVFNGAPASFNVFTRLVKDNGIDFAIQCLPNDDYENLIVPVGLVAAKGTTVKFKANVINLPLNYKVYLEDSSTGTFTRLDEAGSDYSVVMKANSKGVGRFYLHTTQNEPVKFSVSQNNMQIIPIPSQQIIKLNGTIDLPAKAIIYDTTGKVVFSRILNGTEQNEIPFINAVSGIYLLKIESKSTHFSEKFQWIKY